MDDPAIASITDHDYRGPLMRGLLYKLARLLGDVNAVKKGRVGQRVGRRAAGKATGKGLGKLFR